jgi:AAA15 family ATPase/GTPase
MLRSLEIQNFKGIKQGKIENLAQVNILVGRNNSGKSTILDALVLLRCAFVVKDFAGDDGLDQATRRAVYYREGSYDDLWFRTNTNVSVLISAEFNRGPKVSEEWQSRGGRNTPVGKGVARGVQEISETELPPAKEFRINPTMNYSIANYRQNQVWRNVKEHMGEAEATFVALVHMLDSNGIHQRLAERLWPEVVNVRRDTKVIQMLNDIYRTQIKDLTIKSSIGLQRLVASVPQTDVAVNWLGDGIRYAVNILSLGVLLQGTALLVEELETHQHPESLRKLTQALFELAKQQDLQLFLTTHSLELIDYAMEAAEETGLDLKLHHLSLNKEGTLRVTSMSQPDAKLLLDMGIDPRMHYKYIGVT